MTNADAIVRQPLCPRCRYDLAGVVASWSSACPCAGVCSECGLDFLWPDLLRADQLAPGLIQGLLATFDED